MTKRTFFAIFAAVVGISFATTAGAQQVLKVGSTPTRIPFTFLDT
jgi:ABC-type amino acid transport substrate-binding protein